MNDTISITEAAKRFSVSQETVKRWLRKEKLEGYKDEGKWYVKTNNDKFDILFTCIRGKPINTPPCPKFGS